MPVITIADYKAYRGYTGTDFDATIGVVIPIVQDEMERFCSNRFDSATYTDQPHDGTGTGVMYLRSWPVSTLTAVKIRKGDGTTETLAATEYSMETGVFSYGRLLRQPQGGAALGTTADLIPIRVGESPAWPVGRGNILITYTAGYSASGGIAYPSGLKHAAYQLVDATLAERGQSLVSVGQQGMGNENISFRTPMDRAAMMRQLLTTYRRVVL